ncbi:MAG TPA: Ig-like domain-containing protein, partial [Geothrix sp.]
MKIDQRVVRPLLWPVALLSIALAIACGSTGKGSRAPIFGGADPAEGPLSRPQVVLTAPATASPATTGVAINAAITVTFTKDMAPATLSGTSFTVTGPGATPVTGTVTYVSRTATFTPSPLFTASTTYTATITTAATDLAGNQLAGNQGALPAASNYVWTFTTGIAADTIRPRVTLTVPATTLPGPTAGVALNTAINAAFTEDMAPATLTGTTFTVTGPGATAVAGAVTYAQRTATFAPTAVLLASTTYTATITSATTDLAGNQLAGNQAALPAASAYIWTFTTGTTTDTVRPTITLTNPADLATGVVINTAVNATFSKAMDPATISSVTFTVQASGPPSGPLLMGAVVYNAATHVVTFTPSSPLAATTKYTATIVGAKDLAGNLLAAGLVPNPWSFTTGSGVAPGGVALGSAGSFGIMATAAITNTGAATMINGDVSLEPGTSCGLLPIQVNGAIHINDSVSHQARTDLLVAYNFAKTLPPGTTVTGGADLGGVYPLGVPPGTYTSGSTILVSTPVTLDAGGNANAVWVFQIGSSLTSTASVTLANGAQAKNVFWVPTQYATIG